MSRPRSCGWCNYVAILPPLLVFLSAGPLFVQSSTNSSTNFSFPVFLSADDFVMFGNTFYDPEKRSLSTDPSSPSTEKKQNCVKLLYPEKVQMKSRESTATVASFSTSFTFAITLHESAGVIRSGWERLVCGFVFSLTGAHTISLQFQKNEYSKKTKYFFVEFDTYNSYEVDDPSDNHIGVNVNYSKPVLTYNLCGGQTPSCSFPWTGRTYTARIDYNGSTSSLELWFANGTMADGNINTSLPGIIKIPDLHLHDILEDYVYVGFSGNSGSFLDTHELFSWSFESSFPEEENIPESHFFPKRTIVIIIIIICAAAACGVTAIILFFIYYLLRSWRRRSRLRKSSELGSELLVGLRRFSFKELKKATRNFHDGALLGKGGSGSVYKGTISGTAVAVKRFVRDVEHVEREFLAEASSTSQIRHRNLVHLQGWCREDGHFLLVFEYISNGSLDEWLFPGRRRYPRDPKFSRFQVLPLELRVSILAGIAAAVEYLHEEWIKVVLHRDIKSSNVMLDEEFSAYLVDFGLSRVIDHAKRDKTTVMAGTLGYMAPEIHFTGKATKQSDVYSFGVLVLEVVSGRRPINLLVEDPDENHLLVQTVWQAREAGNILRAVLPPLLDVYNNSQDLNPVPDEESNSLPTSSINGLISEIVPEVNGSSLRFERKLVRLLHLGLHCCLPSPEARPSIRVVKQAIMLVMQGEDTVTSALDSVPPLPSTMPVGFASVPPIVPSVEETILAHLDDRDSLASFAPRSDTMSVLRRRFPSTENKSQVD